MIKKKWCPNSSRNTDRSNSMKCYWLLCVSLSLLCCEYKRERWCLLFHWHSEDWHRVKNGIYSEQWGISFVSIDIFCGLFWYVLLNLARSRISRGEWVRGRNIVRCIEAWYNTGKRAVYTKVWIDGFRLCSGMIWLPRRQTTFFWKKLFQFPPKKIEQNWSNIYRMRWNRSTHIFDRIKNAKLYASTN